MLNAHPNSSATDPAVHLELDCSVPASMQDAAFTPLPASPTPDPAEDGSAMASEDSEGQALEAQEVIELQIFSERKAWIEEKILFLQSMPPVDVFVGLDAVRSSAEHVPELPTRAELQQWLIEHDAIERETDMFDSGELQNLRQLTKAATQRNLSPEDTDLIELTLTTIFALDKLLHLLRDRSDSLDLLGTRLTWEDNRIAAWADRREIIAELQNFLSNRARWSPSIYDSITKPDESHKRRNSITSVASDTSTTADAAAAFHRAARFKLAEMLSRDAAQFAGRVTSLKHGKIAAAGKALDKLIDNSRKKVPEELLDEQDRLEEKGISELENMGKFAMNVVMQWRKADEVYVETMKDLATAQNLYEEIETAKLHHPTSRQSVSFFSRAEVLARRLLSRGNPTSPADGFPCPVHPLFPDQEEANAALAASISSDINAAVSTAKTVEAAAKEYRAEFEAVKHVEVLSNSAGELSAQFESILDRLEDGVEADDADGSPPNLTNEACLNPTCHSAFLALLPTIIDEVKKTEESADVILRSSRIALAKLDHPGIDASFKTDAAAEVQRLEQLRNRARHVSDEVTKRVERLRSVRKIWAIVDGSVQELESLRQDVEDAMQKHKWRQQSGQTEGPPTPESPLAALPSSSVRPKDVMDRLEGISKRLSKEVDSALSSLSPMLETYMQRWLSKQSLGLKKWLESVRQLTRLLDNIQKQSEVMTAVCGEFNDIQMRLDDLGLRFDSGTQEVLAGTLTGKELTTVDSDLATEGDATHSAVQEFVDGLSSRVHFVSQVAASWRHSNTVLRRKVCLADLRLGALHQQVAIEPPFDLAALDDAVRNDSNSYAMRLAGDLRKMDQKRDHFQLAQIAQALDIALSSTVDGINRAVQELSVYRSSLTIIVDRGNTTDPLRALSTEVEEFFRARRSSISRSFSPIRGLLSRMNSAPVSQDPAINAVVCQARSRAVDDAELKFSTWNEDASGLLEQILQAQCAEAQRLRREKEQLAKLVAEVDAASSSTRADISQAVHELDTFEASLVDVVQKGNYTEPLHSLAVQVKAFFDSRQVTIAHATSSLRSLISRMDTAPGYHNASGHYDPVAREQLYDARLKVLEDIEHKVESWRTDTSTLLNRISEAQRLEKERLQNEKDALHLLAQQLDSAVLSTRQHLDAAEHALESLKSMFPTIPAQAPATKSWQLISAQVTDLIPTHTPSTDQSLSRLDELLTNLNEAPGYHDTAGHIDPSVLETVYLPRVEAVAAVHARARSWREGVSVLGTQISEAQAAEAQRLREERERLIFLAQEFDAVLGSTIEHLGSGHQKFDAFLCPLSALEGHDNVISLLEKLLADVDEFSQGHQALLSTSLTSLRDHLGRLDVSQGYHDDPDHEGPNAREVFYVARRDAAVDVESKVTVWKEVAASVRVKVLDAQSAEVSRLEQIRALEQRALEERNRLIEFVDSLLRSSLGEICRAEDELASHQKSLLEIIAAGDVSQSLPPLDKKVRDHSEAYNLCITHSMDSLRVALRQLVSLPNQDAHSFEMASRGSHDAQLRFETWNKDVLVLLEHIADAQVTEAAASIDSERDCRTDRVGMNAERAVTPPTPNAQSSPRVGASHDLSVIHEGSQSEGIRTPTEDVFGPCSPLLHSANLRLAFARDAIADDEDVFGPRIHPSSNNTMAKEVLDLQAQILTLRKRLRSININDTARPSSNSSASSHLPNGAQKMAMEAEFSIVQNATNSLPKSSGHPSVDVELRSLVLEVEASVDLMDRIGELAALSDAAQQCDSACSDLLEHVDSYPAGPAGPLSSSHVAQVNSPPEEQLAARLAFTKSVIDRMMSALTLVSDDPRAEAETNRVLQTWVELEDMAQDRINGRKSRPTSVVSSGRNSSLSLAGVHPAGKSKKIRAYAALSVKPSRPPKLQPPAQAKAKRAISGNIRAPPIRPPSLMAHNPVTRSVSGPFISPTSRLYSSTFASRQRTSSLSCGSDGIDAALAKSSTTPARTQTQTGLSDRADSPAVSDAVSLSRSAVTPSRASTASTSTWSRAPRLSFPAAASQISPPRPKPKQQKKTYVANPKNKLDVAVGDVVNRLPVSINIEAVADTWKDQSGKYWIGDQDPKLCFCRILRSQTVMVRVGGGWSELSKFINDHFADLFRLMPLDSQSQGAREEKWISSATLLEAPENADTTTAAPHTPECSPMIPSISLNTPSTRTSQPLKSAAVNDTSPPALTPLQFMRRADPDAPVIPVTPSKAPGSRARIVTPNAPGVLRPGSPLATSPHPTAQPSTSNTPFRGFQWRP